MPTIALSFSLKERLYQNNESTLVISIKKKIVRCNFSLTKTTQMKMTHHIQYWWEYREIGSIYAAGRCKNWYSLFVGKQKIHMIFNLTILHFSIYSRKILATVSLEASIRQLFIIETNWRQPQCPPGGGLFHHHTTGKKIWQICVFLFNTQLNLNVY